MGEIGISYGCGYWGTMMGVNWDTSDCSNVLDGNTGTAYGATVSVVNGQAQFGVMVRLRFVDTSTGNPINLDGSVKLYANVWGSPAVASGTIGWGYANRNTGQMVVVEPFGNQYGNCDRQMSLYRLPAYSEFDGWDYALFAEGIGTYGTMSGARAKIREIEFVEVWPTPTPSPPIAAFDADPRVGVAPLIVDFTDLSTDAAAWLWEFGDGDVSVDRHPRHTYEYPGLYPVALTVANNQGQDTAIKPDFIEVLPLLSRRKRAAWAAMERPLFL